MRELLIMLFNTHSNSNAFKKKKNLELCLTKYLKTEKTYIKIYLFKKINIKYVFIGEF
jgi:hypothetical protein